MFHEESCVTNPPSLERVVALKILCDFKESPEYPCTCDQENTNAPNLVHSPNCIVGEAQETWSYIDALFQIIPGIDPYHEESVFRAYLTNDSFEEDENNSHITSRFKTLRTSMGRFFSETVHFYRKNPELYKIPTAEDIYAVLQLNRIPVEFYNLVSTDLEYCNLLMSEMRGIF